MEKIKKTPGIYKNVPFEEYLSWDCFHKSMVSATLRSTAHLHAYIEEEKKSTKFMDFGSLVDCMLMEPDQFPLLFIEQPEEYPSAKGDMKPWSNNANFCKDWNAEQADQGKTIYKASDYQRALKIVHSIGEHDTAAKWLQGAEYQVAIVWQDEETGIMCKGRLDAITPEMLIDAKTTGNASPKEFKRTCNNFMYHVQDVMYSEGYKAVTGKELPFGFIVAESESPHCVACYNLGPESKETAKSMFRRAITRYKDYLANGPVGYSTEQQEIEIPQYAIYEEDEIELDDSKLEDTV